MVFRYVRSIDFEAEFGNNEALLCSVVLVFTVRQLLLMQLQDTCMELFFLCVYVCVCVCCVCVCVCVCMHASMYVSVLPISEL